MAFPEDSGTFTVVITNCMGETRSSCKLLVRDGPPTDGDFANSPPNITQPLKSKESIEGSKVRMDCTIVGRPEPEVILRFFVIIFKSRQVVCLSLRRLTCKSNGQTVTYVLPVMTNFSMLKKSCVCYQG